MGTRLSLDPGLRSGWALWADDEPTLLANAAFDSRRATSKLGYRYAFGDYARHLRGLLWHHDVQQVAYEKVRFHRGIDAAHMYGAFEAVIHMVCEERDIVCIPVEIGTWKAAVGVSGKAAQYTIAVQALYPLAASSETGDECAAVGIGHCAFVNRPEARPKRVRNNQHTKRTKCSA